MFEKKIRQYGDKFRVQDFTSNDNLDTTNFDEVKNKNGVKVLESKVIILYKDEYTNLIQENQSLKTSLEEKESIINDKDSTIRHLEREIGEKKQSHNNKVNDLSQQISQLENTISELEKNHLQEKANITLEHQKEINNLTLFDEEYHMKISDHEKKISKMKDTLVQLRMQDYQDNKQYIARLRKLGFFQKHTSEYNKILDEMEEKDDKKITIKGDDLLKIASPDKA